MRRLLMSRLIRIFTVRLISLFFIPMFKIWHKQGRCRNLAVCPNIPDFTLVKIQKRKEIKSYSLLAQEKYYMNAQIAELDCCIFKWV